MDPLKITVSIIDILGSVSATYKAIGTIKGLPEAFAEVQYNLPLVRRTLRSVQGKLCDHQEITEDKRNDVVAILESIHDQAQELQRVFYKIKKKCENDEDVKEWSQFRNVYYRALRGVKTSRVEQLMKDILGGMKKLASSQTFKSVSQGDMETLEETIEEAISNTSKLEPSLSDSEFDNNERVLQGDRNSLKSIKIKFDGESTDESENTFHGQINLGVDITGGNIAKSYHGITMATLEERPFGK